MDGTVVDAAVLDRARDAMTAARAAEYAVLAAICELDGNGIVAATGYGSMERLIQDLWRVDLGEARRLVRHSRALCGETGPGGDRHEPTLPATTRAAHTGGLDRAHIRVIDDALHHLERVPNIDPAARAEAEQFLVEHAATLTPRSLTRVAARLIAALDPDGTAPPDEPEPTDELLIGRRRDGTLVLTGRFHSPADIDLLTETFDALSGRAGPDDHRPLDHRHAETLLELCDHATTGGIATDTADTADTADTEAEAETETDGHGTADDTGTDETGTEKTGAGTEPRRRPHAPGRPTIGLTIPLTWLRQQIGHGLLDTDTPLSPADARRLACDAGILPLITGTRSEPLDLGRLRYTVPDGMRRALHHRDRGCAFPGCGRRPGRCHAHHLRHWADGGPTSLENLVLLCRFHHHLIHHGDWTVTMNNGRPWFTPPHWIDPTRQPRPGGPCPN